MRLVTFSANGQIFLGAKLENDIVDLSMGYIAYLDTKAEKKPYEEGLAVVPKDMKRFLDVGDVAMEAAWQTLRFCQNRLAKGESVVGPLGERVIYSESEIRLKAPIPRPSKIVCLGLNYKDHAEEAKAKIPANPIIFSKFNTAVIGFEEAIVYPKIVAQLDYEIELAVVIGKKGRHIAEGSAYDYIAGYTICNDVSARDVQFADGQWVRGKSFDTFAPMGPYLVTRDEIPDPHKLKMQLRVNGQLMQDSNTKNMIFKVPYIVAFLSQAFTLEPGDVISTGTPSGVGVFHRPPALLNAGDVVELEIEGLGILRNPVVAEK